MQQSKYITTANNAFSAERKAKFQAFLDARTAFENAGGISTKGLTDKAAVVARRDLLAKLRTANEDYLTFVTTQVETYRAELAKTPLVPADVDSLAAGFAKQASVSGAVKMQQTEKDLLTCSDEMLADLQKWNGEWSLSSADKLVFKQKSDQKAYSALAKKYNGIVKDMQAQQAQASPTPAPSAAPAPATPAGSATP